MYKSKGPVNRGNIEQYKGIFNNQHGKDSFGNNNPNQKQNNMNQTDIQNSNKTQNIDTRKADQRIISKQNSNNLGISNNQVNNINEGYYQVSPINSQNNQIQPLQGNQQNEFIRGNIRFNSSDPYDQNNMLQNKLGRQQQVSTNLFAIQSSTNSNIEETAKFSIVSKQEKKQISEQTPSYEYQLPIQQQQNNQQINSNNTYKTQQQNFTNNNVRTNQHQNGTLFIQNQNQFQQKEKPENKQLQHRNLSIKPQSRNPQNNSEKPNQFKSNQKSQEQVENFQQPIIITAEDRQNMMKGKKDEEQVKKDKEQLNKEEIEKQQQLEAQQRILHQYDKIPNIQKNQVQQKLECKNINYPEEELFPQQNKKEDEKIKDKAIRLIYNEDIFKDILTIENELSQKQLDFISIENISQAMYKAINNFFELISQQMKNQNQFVLFDVQKVFKNSEQLPMSINSDINQYLQVIHQMLLNEFNTEKSEIFDIKINETMIERFLLFYLKYYKTYFIVDAITFNYSAIQNIPKEKILNFKQNNIKSNFKEIIIQQVKQVLQKILQTQLSRIQKEFQNQASILSSSKSQIQKKYESKRQYLLKLIDKFKRIYQNHRNQQKQQQQIQQNLLQGIVIYKKIEIQQKEIKLLLDEFQIKTNSIVENTLFGESNFNQTEPEEINDIVYKHFMQYLMNDISQNIQKIIRIDANIIDLTNCSFEQATIIFSIQQDGFENCFNQLIQSSNNSNSQDQNIQIEEQIQTFFRKECLKKLFKNTMCVELNQDNFSGYQENHKLYYIYFILNKISNKINSVNYKLYQNEDLKLEYQSYFTTTCELGQLELKFVEKIPLVNLDSNILYITVDRGLQIRELACKLNLNGRDLSIQLDQQELYGNLNRNKRIEQNYSNQSEQEGEIFNLLKLILLSKRTQKPGIIVMYLYEKLQQKKNDRNQQVEFNFIQYLRDIEMFQKKSYQIQSILNEKQIKNQNNKIVSVGKYDVKQIKQDMKQIRDSIIRVYLDNISVPQVIFFNTSPKKTLIFIGDIDNQFYESGLNIFSLFLGTQFQKFILFQQILEIFKTKKKQEIFFYECLQRISQSYNKENQLDKLIEQLQQNQEKMALEEEQKNLYKHGITSYLNNNTVDNPVNIHNILEPQQNRFSTQAYSFNQKEESKGMISDQNPNIVDNPVNIDNRLKPQQNRFSSQAYSFNQKEESKQSSTTSQSRPQSQQQLSDKYNINKYSNIENKQEQNQLDSLKNELNNSISQEKSIQQISESSINKQSELKQNSNQSISRQQTLQLDRNSPLDQFSQRGLNEDPNQLSDRQNRMNKEQNEPLSSQSSLKNQSNTSLDKFDSIKYQEENFNGRIIKDESFNKFSHYQKQIFDYNYLKSDLVSTITFYDYVKKPLIYEDPYQSASYLLILNEEKKQFLVFLEQQYYLFYEEDLDQSSFRISISLFPKVKKIKIKNVYDLDVVEFTKPQGTIYQILVWLNYGLKQNIRKKTEYNKELEYFKLRVHLCHLWMKIFRLTENNQFSSSRITFQKLQIQVLSDLVKFSKQQNQITINLFTKSKENIGVIIEGIPRFSQTNPNEKIRNIIFLHKKSTEEFQYCKKYIKELQEFKIPSIVREIEFNFIFSQSLAQYLRHYYFEGQFELSKLIKDYFKFIEYDYFQTIEILLI